jgi:hypothetical protein
MPRLLKWTLILLGAGFIVALVVYFALMYRTNKKKIRGKLTPRAAGLPRQGSPNVDMPWRKWSMVADHEIDADTRCLVDSTHDKAVLVRDGVAQYYTLSGENQASLVFDRQCTLPEGAGDLMVVSSGAEQLAVCDRSRERLWVLGVKGEPREVDLEPDVHVHHLQYQNGMLWVGASDDESGMVAGYDEQLRLRQKLTGGAMFGLHFDVKPGVMVVASPQDAAAYQFVFKESDGRFHHQKKVQAHPREENSMFPLKVAVDEYAHLTFLADPTRSLGQHPEVGAVHQGTQLIVSTLTGPYQYFGDEVEVRENHMMVSNRQGQTVVYRMDCRNQWKPHQVLPGRLVSWRHDADVQSTVWFQDDNRLRCYRSDAEVSNRGDAAITQNAFPQGVQSESVGQRKTKETPNHEHSGSITTRWSHD